MSTSKNPDTGGEYYRDEKGVLHQGNPPAVAEEAIKPADSPSEKVKTAPVPKE